MPPIWGLPEPSWGPPGVLPGLALLAPSWGASGALPGLSRGSPGALLGLSWGHSWGRLSWDLFWGLSWGLSWGPSWGLSWGLPEPPGALSLRGPYGRISPKYLYILVEGCR